MTRKSPRQRTSSYADQYDQPSFSDDVTSGSNSHIDRQHRHLGFLFIYLNLFAVHAVYNAEHHRALAISLPTLFLLLALGRGPFYNFFGIPFWYLLPYGGKIYYHSRWIERKQKTVLGPASDHYVAYIYMIPLYLALWYASLALFYSVHTTTFFLVAVLFVSKPYYWLSQHYCPRLSKYMLDLHWQFYLTTIIWGLDALMKHPRGLAAPSTWAWTVWVAALLLACRLVAMILGVWSGTVKLQRQHLWQPYKPYYDSEDARFEDLEVDEPEALERSWNIPKAAYHMTKSGPNDYTQPKDYVEKDLSDRTLLHRYLLAQHIAYARAEAASGESISNTSHYSEATDPYVKKPWDPRRSWRESLTETIGNISSDIWAGIWRLGVFVMTLQQQVFMMYLPVRILLSTIDSNMSWVGEKNNGGWIAWYQFFWGDFWYLETSVLRWLFGRDVVAYCEGTVRALATKLLGV
ncbi:hypothetical protein N0V90_005210 [Kalmusia sp. IMI 367209]|nr:hypothetical protein N0V90_005210 [Kalmusia sp. IMI 367209]